MGTLANGNDAALNAENQELKTGNQKSSRPARRERPKVVKLTDAAAQRMQAIMANADEDFIGVKIGVKNGGCAGMEYTMDYAVDIGPLDETVEDNGVRILIDPKAILFLIGTEIDFIREKLSQRFVFNNPNQTDACGCGESVTIIPAANT